MWLMVVPVNGMCYVGNITAPDTVPCDADESIHLDWRVRNYTYSAIGRDEEKSFVSYCLENQFLIIQYIRLLVHLPGRIHCP